ncbi:Ig-like domain-containing protein [Gemmatimonadota bacterium]
MRVQRLIAVVLGGLPLASCGESTSPGSEPSTVDELVASVIIIPDASGISGVGTTQQFTVEARDANGNLLPSPSVSWTSLNAHVATVDGIGLATAVASGQVPVVAKVDTLTAYALLTVSVPGMGPVTQWSAHPSEKQNYFLSAVWGASAGDVYATGFRRTLHYDGAAWSEILQGGESYVVGGMGPNDVYAVGSAVFHYDGSGWREQPSGTTEGLSGVWGASPDDVYAVGDHGTIVHYDGTDWREQSSGTTEHLTDVWGTGASDVYAVGVHGTILHFDGTGWREQSSGTTLLLMAVWGTSPNDVYVVGDAGTILHTDGSGWRVHANLSGWLWGVWGSSPSDIYAVGIFGAIHHYDGSDWSALGELDANGEHLRGVWAMSSSDVYVVGGDGRIFQGTR